jgi:hypothetical protein
MSRRNELAISLLLILPFRVFSGKTALIPATTGSGSIAPTGDTIVPRFSHTATLLPNHKVLIAGGMERNGVWLSSAEIYDPAKAQFTAAPDMSAPRAGATATLLPNGKILIAGGSTGAGKSTTSAELFDPERNTFTATESMHSPRADAVAVLLPSGKVLIAGGAQTGDENRSATAEIYNPASGTFSSTGNMHVRRAYFSATRLKDGRVLVTGGDSTGHLPKPTVEASSEIYDPETGLFSLAGNMAVPRYKHGSALLPDGRVLIVGGQNNDSFSLGETEIFDARTGKFLRGPDLNMPRFKLPAGVVALKDGRILIGGGGDHVEMYTPATNGYSLLPGTVLDGFLFSSETLLTDGKVLLVGGYGHHPMSGAVNHAWIWTP